ERPHDPCPQIRDRRHVEDHPSLGQLLQERRVLDSADAVAYAVGLERVESAADGLRADHLAGMGHRRESLLLRETEDVHELLRRIEGLLAAEADPDDPAIAVGRRMAHELEAVLDR